MNTHACHEYRAADVATAPQEKLRLMLIDAALAAIHDARRHVDAFAWLEAADAFVRSRRVVIELLCGVKPAADPLARKVRGLYVYLFRLLTEAQLFRDRQRLDDALRLLTLERDTWEEICRRRGSPPEGEPSPPRSEDWPTEPFSSQA